MAYIKDLRNMYNDGRANHTSAQLMVLAENKYKERVQSGDWGQPSEEQAEIVALTAKLHTVEKQLNARSSNQTKKTSSGKQQGKASTKNSSNKRPATTADASNKSKQNKYAWKDVKPSGNETKVDGHPTKKKDDKLYYWCLNHNDGKGKWVLHHPNECNNTSNQQQWQQRSSGTDTVNMATFDTMDSGAESSDQE